MTSQLQKQYREPKRRVIMLELSNRNIEYRPDMNGRSLHKLLLDSVEPEESEPDIDDIEKLEEANRFFIKRKETSPDIWAAAVKNAGVDELGLADLDEADRFDACFLEVIEGG